MKERKDRHVVICVTERDKSWLEQIAEREDTSASVFMRQLLRREQQARQLQQQPAAA